ncbi:hypothetical protein PAPHI01_1314 [Pancytospora philotis]|nr:hypothetical protein PAPHI01_1314 [Pancytospora philotis]
MKAAILLTCGSAAMQHGLSMGSFAVGLYQEYALKPEQIACAYDQLFEHCLIVNATRDESMKLSHRDYDVYDGERSMRYKKPFIKLLVLSEENPIALIEQCLALPHPHRTLEALHATVFDTTLDNVQALLKPAKYNAPPGSDLRIRLYENCEGSSLNGIKKYLCAKIEEETKEPWCVYVQSKDMRGVKNRLEPIDAFLYLLRRAASHGVDFDAELRGILESTLVNAKEAALTGTFLRDFMKKIVAMKGSREQHTEYCMHMLFDTLAAVKNEVALWIARWDAFSIKAQYSVMEYVRNAHEADISAYFAINCVYPLSYSNNCPLRVADDKYNALYNFFFNASQMEKGFPRMKELLQDDALLARLPFTFCYRILDDLCTNLAGYAPLHMSMILSLLARLPQNTFDIVERHAIDNRNINLVGLLPHRQLMAIILQQNPLV